MSTISQPTKIASKPSRRAGDLFVRNMWAGLGITVMWLAVLLDALLGPNLHFVSSSPGGSTSDTTIPSAVILALFAWLATRAVATYGFTSAEDDAE